MRWAVAFLLCRVADFAEAGDSSRSCRSKLTVLFRSARSLDSIRSLIGRESIECLEVHRVTHEVEGLMGLRHAGLDEIDERSLLD